MANNNWEEYLNDIRTQEINIVFKEFNEKQFKNGLELGAGNGFQSSMIINYCEQLVATDFNELRLLKSDISNIKYQICDAEKIETYFEKDKFDLVFSSNMFEHLPSPQKALIGLNKILKHDGLIILIMPSVFWKYCHMFLFYPVTITNIIRRKIFKRNTIKKKSKKNHERIERAKGNNIKMETLKRNYFFDLIRWPKPHGVSKSNLEEFMKFRKSNWINLFEENGFSVVDVKRGPITSGYGLRFNRLRDILWNLGFTSEYIYYLKKKNE
jgi:SAM-dependent methyltransferase